MIIGGSLLVLGWLMLLFNVMKLIPQHIGLMVLAYAFTLVGVTIGLYGVLMYVRRSRNDLN